MIDTGAVPSSTEGTRNGEELGDEMSTTSKPLPRCLTTSTILTNGFVSDTDSLFDESEHGEQDLSLDRNMSKMEKNPLEKALRSVTKKVKSWRKKLAKRRQLQEAHLVEQVQKETEFANSPEGIRLRQKRLESLGEMGVALFAPIEGAFGDDRDDHEDHKKELLIFRTETPAEHDSVNDDHGQVHVVPDDPTIPRLLSEGIMTQLAKAMPFTLHGRSWKRLFSISRDGDSFGTFMDSVKRNDYTVIVVQTTRGEIIGGFADAAWDCRTIEGCFYGAGTSFLFSLIQSNDHPDPFQIYRWRGVNDYSQMCRQGCIGMGGGGGSFGLCVQDDFTKGSSGACETYGNSGPLTSSQCFDVLNFEVYGFADRTW